jgi:hypothetical protein
MRFGEEIVMNLYCSKRRRKEFENGDEVEREEMGEKSGNMIIEFKGAFLIDTTPKVDTTIENHG